MLSASSSWPFSRDTVWAICWRGRSCRGSSRAEQRWHRAGHGDTWGAVGAPGCWGGTASSRCPLHELLGMAFHCALGASRTRWQLRCGISKGTAWARWYPELGGARCQSVRPDDTRGHEICWNSFVGDGKGGCKAALDPSSPIHHPLARTSFPCTFCRITSVNAHELSR